MPFICASKSGDLIIAEHGKGHVERAGNATLHFVGLAVLDPKNAAEDRLGKDCSPASTNAIGTVVFAIFKIEDGTLTFAEDDMSAKPPKTFASASSRYTDKKVQPQKENAQPLKTE